MWNTKKKIIYLFYCIFGRWLPESHRMKFANKARSFFARRILKTAGKELTVERGSYFTPGVSIG